jgi:hypothetical protein
MRLRCLILSLLLLGLLPAASAGGDGPATDRPAGPDGVLGPGGTTRFGALATVDGTAVTKTQVRGGRVLRARLLQGNWGVPVVAGDGTAGGVSADGSTLVLVRQQTAVPSRRTTFAMLGANRLRVHRRIELRGKWNYDALSPDASTLYLIQTLSRKTGRYAVRAYDLRAGRLLPDPVVDPSEPDEPMRGFAVTRITGPGGRWEYTLYAGGEHPFIHALDTVDRKAVCIDLATPPRGNPYSFRLDVSPGGGELRVLNGKRGPMAVVNARSFEVTQPPAVAKDERGGFPWLALGGAAAVLAAGALALLARRRRRPTAEAVWPPDLQLNGAGGEPEAEVEPETAGRR